MSKTKELRIWFREIRTTLEGKKAGAKTEEEKPEPTLAEMLGGGL